MNKAIKKYVELPDGGYIQISRGTPCSKCGHRWTKIVHTRSPKHFSITCKKCKHVWGGLENWTLDGLTEPHIG